MAKSSGYLSWGIRCGDGRLWLTGLALAAGLALGTSGCRKGTSGRAESAEVPVLAGEVEQRDAPVEVRDIGTVEAYSTVDVKSLIAGELVAVGVREGQTVKTGDLLFTIDPRPYEAALHQAQANLARDTAQSDKAVRDEARVSALYARGAATRDELDTAQTDKEALAAAVKADQAAIETAQIQLGYCRISSPITGVAGNLLVNEGNVVKANDVTLITLNQVQPIYVAFSVPQEYLPDIRKYRQQGPLTVAVSSIEDGRPLATGELVFIDNTIDPTTGTIRLKGQFSNEDLALWPGQFVNVTLTLAVQKDAVVLPSQALQTGQEGQFVYVIGRDMTVELRKVDVHRAIDSHSVVTGVAPGERIVTDGQLRLFPGAKVEVKSALTSQPTTTREAKGP
jgi:multidrug efflux system membrane fusion protein